jgi:1,2-diacylglycerol 3-beta-galactosyltransferase
MSCDCLLSYVRKSGAHRRLNGKLEENLSNSTTVLMDRPKASRIGDLQLRDDEVQSPLLRISVGRARLIGGLDFRIVQNANKVERVRTQNSAIAASKVAVACTLVVMWKLFFLCFWLSSTAEWTAAFSPNLRTTSTRLDVAAYIRTTTAAIETDEVCTVQILMSDTGGGHRASANALRDAFDTLHPGRIQCDIVDIYTEYGPFWPYDSYIELYKFAAKYPITWDIFYHFGATDFGIWLNRLMLELFCFEPFKTCLSRPSGNSGKKADMVVSVHPLTQDIPLRILAELDSNGATRERTGRKTPFCTVVTDLGSAHPTWFNKEYVTRIGSRSESVSILDVRDFGDFLVSHFCFRLSCSVDKCFVPSDALYLAAKKRQLQDSQIVQYGLPIRQGFWANSESAHVAPEKVRKSLRRQLGLDENLPTVLIVGGGDGMGGIVEISKSLGVALGTASTTTQMVVVCGNNQEAKASLEKESWGTTVRVNVQGFVENMDEWMKASDALVTKAGPGTIAEASICGLPCMLFSYL